MLFTFNLRFRFQSNVTVIPHDERSESSNLSICQVTSDLLVGARNPYPAKVNLPVPAVRGSKSGSYRWRGQLITSKKVT